MSYDSHFSFQSIHGAMHISGTTLLNFPASSGCRAGLNADSYDGMAGGTYAIGNHVKMVDVFHPHFMCQMNVQVCLISLGAQSNFLVVCVRVRACACVRVCA